MSRLRRHSHIRLLSSVLLRLLLAASAVPLAAAPLTATADAQMMHDVAASPPYLSPLTLALLALSGLACAVAVSRRFPLIPSRVERVAPSPRAAVQPIAGFGWGVGN